MKFRDQRVLTSALTHLRDLVCVVDLYESLWVIRKGMVSIQIPACLPGHWENQNPTLVLSVLCTCGINALCRHMPGVWDMTSLGLALNHPFSSPPGKGGERNAYTAFGRDASVGSLTQVRLCL